MPSLGIGGRAALTRPDIMPEAVDVGVGSGDPTIGPVQVWTT